MDKKRLWVTLALLASVIVGVVLYIVLAGGFTWDSIIVIIVVLLFLVFSIPRFIINRHDKVGDDEYSKKMMRVVAARSYMVSLYTWLAMMWFSKPLDDYFEATTTKIGIGIGIMAIVFLVNAIIIKFTGVPD